MKFNKRRFLKTSALALTSLPFAGQIFASNQSSVEGSKATEPPIPTALANITLSVQPIGSHERLARISKAQALMKTHNISALVIEPGPTMDYFSGVQWWLSERVTALVIPQNGSVEVVCPFFEEPSIRESLSVDANIRVWQEHESPFAQIKQILADNGINKGQVAFDFSVRFFVQQGVMALLPHMQALSADPVTRGCRMYKSANELTLMHKANEVTLTAYAHVYKQLAIGMTSSDVSSLMAKAQSALGGSNVWNMVLINEASAFPHGTKQKQTISEGSIVLMDCGCSVHGYQSDISRTFVVGKANKKQQEIWQTVRKGQQIAFDTAQIGVAAGSVDDKVRTYYQTLGLGPDYQLPGLSHRTGHGIGMKGHEGINFVHGEKTTLKSGMCFSNEPGIYIPNEFGVRLEDCLYITDKGPRWFTIPPDSLNDPVGKVAELVLS